MDWRIIAHKKLWRVVIFFDASDVVMSAIRELRKGVQAWNRRGSLIGESLGDREEHAKAQDWGRRDSAIVTLHLLQLR